MKAVEKKILKKNNVEIGYILSLAGKVGLETPSDSLAELNTLVGGLKRDFTGAVIVLDTSNLVRWDTYGMKIIIPPILEVNKSLRSLGRPPISIIGDADRDIFSAVRERWARQAEDIPWFLTVEKFFEAYNI
jgi:hypothetical protein